MNIFDREDIYEQNELSKVIDDENIPFEELMSAFVGFICNVLMAKDNLRKLNIDVETEIEIRDYALQGEAFLDKSITKEVLKETRMSAISAWKTQDGFIADSVAKTLLRIVICSLYNKEDAEYDTHGSGEMLGVFFSLLLDLGSGYCKQFRYYLQEKLA